MTKKLIGKGEFTKAYRLEDGRVELHSKDWAKEVIALWGSDNPYLPQLKPMNVRADTGYQDVYTCPYYGENLRKSDISSHQWSYYRLLQDELAGYRNYNEHVAIIEGLKIPTRMKDALLELCSLMSNYAYEFSFEFSPRNLRARYGRLFFLDVIFAPENRGFYD